MPNRIVKESLCESEKIAGLTDFEFRLWIGLIVSADDFGRGDARPAILKGRIFPLRERTTVKDIDNALHGLAAAGCISLYSVGGKSYFAFPTWANHQRVRNQVQKYPAPDEADALDAVWPQSAATRGNSPQSAATRGLNPESEYNPNPESESRIQKSNPKADAFTAFAGDDAELLKALRDFEAMRKKIGKPLTERAMGMIGKKLQTFPQEQWIPILDQSILHCWQGVFPLKDEREKSNPWQETSDQLREMYLSEEGGEQDG